MQSLKGTKTHANLKDAFAGESQANRRYLYFAKVADVEGQPEIAGLFRDTAEGETGHAHGFERHQRCAYGYEHHERRQRDSGRRGGFLDHDQRNELRLGGDHMG